jgi:transposase
VGQVIIGMDPHKRSATIEVINDRENVLAQGRFGTDRAGYQTMLKLGRQHKDRIWAVEGSNGIGKHIAQRLVADGETVVDVPAKLSARARVFDTGQGRRPTPLTHTASRSRPCTARVCGRSSPTTRQWRCGCWPRPS